MRRRALLMSGRKERPLIFTIDTTKAGVTDSYSFRIPTHTLPSYNYSIDHGDGTITSGHTGSVDLVYSIPGIYQVKIYGKFPRFYFNNAGDKLKMISIDSWGTNHQIYAKSFYGCSNMVILSNDGTIPRVLNYLPNALMGIKVTDPIPNFENWDFSKADNFDATFHGWYNYGNSLNLNLSAATAINSCFRMWTNYYNALTLITSSNLQLINEAFRESKFTSIVLSDASGVTNTTNMLYKTTQLVNLILPGLAISFDMRYSTNFPESAYLDLIDSLADMTGLTAPTITVKNNANWTSACDTALGLKNWNVSKV